jgi:hypothetical protein
MSKTLRVNSYADITCPLCGDTAYDHHIGGIRKEGLAIQVRCLTHGIISLFYETKTGKIRNEFGEEVFHRAPRLTKKRREYLDAVKSKKTENKS